MLRQVEKAVTRMAGELCAQLNIGTMLPDNQGNFMTLFADVMASPHQSEPREAFVEYLRQLLQWLFVSLGAYRDASIEFVEELRRGLSPLGLSLQDPVPTLQRLLGRQDKIYWHRAQAYLQGFSRRLIEERINELAKGAAREMLGDPK